MAFGRRPPSALLTSLSPIVRSASIPSARRKGYAAVARPWCRPRRPAEGRSLAIRADHPSRLRPPRLLRLFWPSSDAEQSACAYPCRSQRASAACSSRRSVMQVPGCRPIAASPVSYSSCRPLRRPVQVGAQRRPL